MSGDGGSDLVVGSELAVRLPRSLPAGLRDISRRAQAAGPLKIEDHECLRRTRLDRETQPKLAILPLRPKVESGTGESLHMLPRCTLRSGDQAGTQAFRTARLPCR